MKHRILFMARELDHGGSERQLTETVLALDRSRFEPRVGVFRSGGARAAELLAADVPIVQFPVHSFRSGAAARGVWELARYVRTDSIRLVHTFDLPLTAYAIPVTRLFTPAVALASQRCHLDIVPRPMRAALKVSERMAHGVVVNCESVKRHLVDDAGIPPSRIHVCPNGIDLDRFRRGPRTRPATLPEDALVVGVVSVLRPEKGLATLLEAFARVGRSANVRLAIVGGGPMRDELERQARALGIFQWCVFEPPTAEVPGWLRNMDIFVLPSLSEAFSNSLMEAMACGCCPVASRAGGNPELVRDGVTGLLFEPGNAAQLACALETLLLNPELRRRLADAAHDHLHANFSSAAAARRMAEIYSGLLAE
jgi:glycosyltransferase involved in cell wall biosynthesis